MIVSIYVKIYVYLLLFYIWYRFLLRFIHDLSRRKRYPELIAKVSIIIPVYNEIDYILEMCIEKLIKAKGNNQIIVVDDCSTNNSLETIKALKKRFPKIIALHLKKNRGKRYAQYYGLKYATGEFIVTVDSDSIVDENAIMELIKPFNDHKVGATTGQVRALNREYNLLTKMIDARYLNAFSFERAALSSFGIVTCCSGVLSAYRKDIITSLAEVYISQKFLGKECTYGDDRYLTNLVLKKGYKTKYVKDAVVRTEVPYKLKQYIKQQLRWKKSFIRESLITFSYAFKKSKLLTLETSLNLVIPFFSLFARILIVYLIIISPLILIPVVLSIIVIAFIRNMLLFFEEGRVAFYSIPYAFLHETIIYWLYWLALFSLRDTKWGTR